MSTTLKFIAVITTLIFQNHMKAQNWETPIIEGYGKIVHYEDAQNMPDPTQEYKIIFHVKDDKERESVNEGLWKVARLINLMGSYKVPKDHLKIVVIISGPATPMVLKNEEHQKRMDQNNPNLELLEKLKNFNVQLLVCGQALAKHHINAKLDMNPYVGVTVSALTAIPYYERQGYVPIF